MGTRGLRGISEDEARVGMGSEVFCLSIKWLSSIGFNQFSPNHFWEQEVLSSARAGARHYRAVCCLRAWRNHVQQPLGKRRWCAVLHPPADAACLIRFFYDFFSCPWILCLVIFGFQTLCSSYFDSFRQRDQSASQQSLRLCAERALLRAKNKSPDSIGTGAVGRNAEYRVTAGRLLHGYVMQVAFCTSCWPKCFATYTVIIIHN